MFRLGRLIADKGPGLVLLMPVDRPHGAGVAAHRDARRPAPGRDHARQRALRVDAVVYFRVVDPERRRRGRDYLQATTQIAQTTLRSVLGKADLDTLLSEREKLNEELQQIIDEQTEPWGVKVRRSRSRTSASRRRCSARWPARPRPSASAARR